MKIFKYKENYIYKNIKMPPKDNINLKTSPIEIAISMKN